MNEDHIRNPRIMEHSMKVDHMMEDHMKDNHMQMNYMKDDLMKRNQMKEDYIMENHINDGQMKEEVLNLLVELPVETFWGQSTAENNSQVDYSCQDATYYDMDYSLQQNTKWQEEFVFDSRKTPGQGPAGSLTYVPIKDGIAENNDNREVEVKEMQKKKRGRKPNLVRNEIYRRKVGVLFLL